MLRTDTWERVIPGEPTRRVATLPMRLVRHPGQTPASLSAVLREHCVDFRSLYRTRAWTRDPGDASHAPAGDAYAVLGWTNSTILRTTLSRRLDALNPVAAFRLLEQPEIERIERVSAEYVVLRSRYGYGNEWPPELAGAISGLDVDLWIAPGPTELDGAVALELGTYLQRFAATEFAD